MKSSGHVHGELLKLRTALSSCLCWAAFPTALRDAATALCRALMMIAFTQLADGTPS